MKIRMIFGTYVEIDGKRVDLKCDTTPDVPKEIAIPLIKRGRAESAEPVATQKKGE